MIEVCGCRLIGICVDTNDQFVLIIVLKKELDKRCTYMSMDFIVMVGDY